MQQQPIEFYITKAAEGDVAAQHIVGQYLLQQQKPTEALPYLHAAAEQGHPRASESVGLMLLTGNGVKQNLSMAFEYFRSAAMKGDAQCMYRCAELLVTGIGVERQLDTAMVCLLTSAQQGYPLALRSLGVVLSQQAPELAAQALLLASLHGDPLAQHSYALLKLHQDPATAKFWFEQAAARGVLGAQRELQALAEVQVAATPSLDMASALAELSAALADFNVTLPVLPEALVHHDELGVQSYVDYFNAIECDYLLHMGAPLLEPATVIGSDASLGANPHRTGDTATLGEQHLDVALQWLQLKMSMLAQLPAEHSEPLAIIRYQVGQEYKLHGDYLPPDSEFCDPRYGGQRAKTVLVYLNDDFEGGATEFPSLGLSIVPRRGAALVFNNLTANGEIASHSQHCGAPVISGEKWLASKWVRQQARR